MTLYEFRCQGCGTVTAAEGSKAKTDLEQDPACGLCGGILNRVWQLGGVHYRAPGFDATRDDPGGRGWSRKQRARARKQGAR